MKNISCPYQSSVYDIRKRRISYITIYTYTRIYCIYDDQWKIYDIVSIVSVGAVI